MKTTKILSILIIILLTISCAKDDDFSVPKSLGNEKNEILKSVLDSIKSGNITEISINKLKTDFFKSLRPKQVKGNYVVKGYVTSSDESGNFYKELYIQDKIKNPTSAIKIALNFNNYFNHFNVGREVYIRLKGLYIGETRVGDKNPTIGGFVKVDKRELKPISENQIKKHNHILRSEKTEILTPLTVKFSEITDDYLGIFVKVDNVSFSEELKGGSYFNPKENFSTERKMLSCEGYEKKEFILETTSFANFGAKLLPTGGGSIAGIITKDYDKNLRMAINSTNDVKMDGKICIPDKPVYTLKNLTDLRKQFKNEDIIIAEYIKIKVVLTSNIIENKVFSEDKTAGILLNFDKPNDLKLGDEIEIILKNAKLHQQENILQLDVKTDNIINKYQGILKPKIITIKDALTDKYESRLVKIKEVQFKDITKNYLGDNKITSNCSNEIILSVKNNAVFANNKVSDKKGTITGIISNNKILIRNLSDVNFTEPYGCNKKPEKPTVTPNEPPTNDKKNNKFDFESINKKSTYTTTGELTASDGTILKFKGKTSSGKYAINNKGLMLRNTEYIEITFKNGVKQLKFKYRGAYTDKSDRIIIIYEGDENSTTELKKHSFAYNTTNETFSLNLNKTGTYTITIKGGTKKQIVIDDIEWNN
ncbi:MAG: hypothetical protein KGV59_02060 [Tenacibaculum sp.]|nr:hypothetical protein [Tenacibaculum sp.]